MSLAKAIRAAEAAHRRQERAAKARERELARVNKEYARLSKLDQARLEVDSYENRIETLLSIHKECGNAWDWNEVAAKVNPPRPERSSWNQDRLERELNFLTANEKNGHARLECARKEDDAEFRRNIDEYDESVSQTRELAGLARRILGGEESAYRQAIAELNPFAELGDFGSSVHFVIHDSETIECNITVRGEEVIPAEQKSLTAAGKVSTRAMPKVRRHEIFQDYVSGCVLRLAREVFALLPVSHLLITATVAECDSSSGAIVEKKALSAIIPRATFQQLNFEQLDPSDSMDNFKIRGQLKRTRQGEMFEVIEPFTISDIERTNSSGALDLAKGVSALRQELRIEMERIAA